LLARLDLTQFAVMSAALTAKRPREVFVSHANADRRFVNRLVAVLEEHGVPLWYSRKALVGAQQWHDEIGAALRRCDWFLLVLSPAAVNSEWVKRELLFALNDRRFRGRIVPLVGKPCDPDTLSWTLQGFQKVDISVDFEKGCADLLRIWGLAFRGLVKDTRRKVSRK